jgi:hypothetical protein
LHRLVTELRPFRPAPVLVPSIWSLGSLESFWIRPVFSLAFLRGRTTISSLVKMDIKLRFMVTSKTAFSTAMERLMHFDPLQTAVSVYFRHAVTIQQGWIQRWSSGTESSMR